MHLTFRNVNDAFRSLVQQFQNGGESGDHSDWCKVVRRPSRNGSVLMIDEPVTVTYTHPRERVLFNATRDANPFFHLYESLWMLAGRNDVAPLTYYSKQMREYSDDEVTLNGAYGYRWRQANTYYDTTVGNLIHGTFEVKVKGCDKVDQLDIIVAHLKADPNSRRAVLQMWNVEDDLLKIGPSQTMTFKEKPGNPLVPVPGTEKFPDYSKDVCCNLSVMFSLRDQGKHGPIDYVLDMTVTNRSNDMVWGMLGANYVHFTMLQEYMAARLGVEVGRYHHFSNNLHVYDEPDKKGIPKWKPDEWLADRIPDLYGIGAVRERGPIRDTFPLVKDPAVFDEEVKDFAETYWGDGRGIIENTRYSEPFLEHVAKPMMVAFRYWKRKDEPNVYLSFADNIQADDWRIACTNWLEKRVKA